ncbi:MAG: hypothetical protein V4594_16825 [Bacteroidota bacterium]
MNNSHPILFSTPMVQAIIEGRKTMTRREVTPQPGEGTHISYMPNEPIDWNGEWYPFKWETEEGESINKHARAAIGDILWVRETFFKNGNDYIYLADGSCCEQFEQCECREIGKPKWKPSIHMPKEACRLFLKVTNVRVEKLHEISTSDAKAEGVAHVIDKITGYCGYNYLHGGYNLMTTPYHGFKSLWKKINGEESWNENPWVWVISFEITDKPLNF